MTKYITWLKKANVIDMLNKRVSYLRKQVNDKYLDIQQQKKMKKQFLTYWDTPHQ